MSYDLVIWNRSATTKTAMLTEVYHAICDDNDHPAMAPFDVGALEQALEAEFGNFRNDPDGLILGGAGRGASANWFTVECGHSNADLVISKVVPIAISQGLMVYDPQRQCVWGNKRPKKPSS